jgi:hypothetical protein
MRQSRCAEPTQRRPMREDEEKAKEDIDEIINERL